MKRLHPLADAERSTSDMPCLCGAQMNVCRLVARAEHMWAERVPKTRLEMLVQRTVRHMNHRVSAFGSVVAVVG